MRHNDNLSHPEVSVITPLYNSSPHIEGTLDALRAQTFESWESILVDDGSTDDTAEKVKAYLQDKRFTYVKQENGGIAAARNAGIRAARGKWVCLLDHDDCWLPAKLEKQLAFAHTNNYDIVCTDAVVVRGSARSLYSEFYPPDFIAEVRRSASDATADVFALLIRYNYLCASSVLLKKSLFDECGLFDPVAAPADDYDMWLRCLSVGARIGYLNEPLIEYVIHDGNFSHNLSKMVEKLLYVLHKAAVLHAGDERRSKQFNDALISGYQLLLKESLERRRYGAALRCLTSLFTKGRRGLRLLYWAADHELLALFARSLVVKTEVQRSVFDRPETGQGESVELQPALRRAKTDA